MNPDWMAAGNWPLENGDLRLWQEVEQMMGIAPILSLSTGKEYERGVFYPEFNRDCKEWRMTDQLLQLVNLSLFEMLAFFHFSDPLKWEYNVFAVSRYHLELNFYPGMAEAVQLLLGTHQEPSKVFTYELVFDVPVTKEKILSTGASHVYKFLSKEFHVNCSISSAAATCYCLESYEGARKFKSDLLVEPRMEALLLHLEQLHSWTTPCINLTGYSSHVDQRLLECTPEDVDQCLNQYGLYTRRKNVTYPVLRLY
jgi:hypothetical protein